MEFEGQNLVGLVIFMILMIPKLVDIRSWTSISSMGGTTLNYLLSGAYPPVLFHMASC